MARYENLFNKSIKGGSEYMEHFGKSRSRRLRPDEHIDSFGYIRRESRRRGGSELLVVGVLVMILILIRLILDYWAIILAVVASLTLLTAIIVLSIRYLKEQARKRDYENSYYWKQAKERF